MVSRVLRYLHRVLARLIADEAAFERAEPPQPPDDWTPARAKEELEQMQMRLDLLDIEARVLVRDR